MTNLEHVFADSARRTAASLPEPSIADGGAGVKRSIARRRVARSVGSASVAILTVGALALGAWAIAGRAPIEPGPAPSSSGPTPAPTVASSPTLPDADVEFDILAEPYPSAWDALELQPVQVTQGEGEDDRYDGSVWHTVTREDGSVQLGIRNAGGQVTMLTDWLPTDQGQKWDPIAASGEWFVYADNAGWHEDGPASAPGLVLLNTGTGTIDIVEVRTFAEKQPSCLDCMNAQAVTQAQIVGDWLYWVVIDPNVSGTEGVLSSRLLAGGPTTDLLTGNYHLDDASCVTTPDADVRVSGYASGDVTMDSPRLAWDVSGDVLTLATPERGPREASGPFAAQTCARVDVVAWYTYLDESTQGDSIATDADGRPMLLNAIDFVGPDGRARFGNDDPLVAAVVTSQIRGWAVVQVFSMDGGLSRFLLLDTNAWRIYEVTPPDGAVATYATVHEGRLVAYLQATDATAQRSIMSASLP